MYPRTSDSKEKEGMRPLDEPAKTLSASCPVATSLSTKYEAATTNYAPKLFVLKILLKINIKNNKNCFVLYYLINMILE